MWGSRRPFCGYEKSCTLLSNSQGCVGALEDVCRRAWDMYSSRAFLHQYSRYGLEADDFMHNFYAVEQIIKNYSSLTYFIVHCSQA